MLLRNLSLDESGASLVEYSILIGLVTAAAVGSIAAIADPKIVDTWDFLNSLWSDAVFDQWYQQNQGPS